MDPTGDNFNGGGLNRTCAVMVQVLHTDVQRYGTSRLLGDSDFFASRTSANQPGCTHNFCDHTKAIYFYYASIFSQYGFIGNDCDQVCTISNCISRFGLYNDGINGDFCFGVTACFPYALQTVTTTTSTSLLPPYAIPPRPVPLPPRPPSLPPYRPPYLRPSLPPLISSTPFYLPPKRHKKRKPHRREQRPCQRLCRKNCRRNCKCCSK